MGLLSGHVARVCVCKGRGPSPGSTKCKSVLSLRKPLGNGIPTVTGSLVRSIPAVSSTIIGVDNIRDRRAHGAERMEYGVSHKVIGLTWHVCQLFNSQSHQLALVTNYASDRIQK